MESLLSLPWNIEVMLSRDATPTAGVQLRLDTFIVVLPGGDSPSAGAAAVGTPGATKIVSFSADTICRNHAPIYVLVSQVSCTPSRWKYLKTGAGDCFQKVRENTHSCRLPLVAAQVVRGILVDSAGKPTCHPLESHLTLHARLCVGACAVDRRGNVDWHSTSSPMDKHVRRFEMTHTELVVYFWFTPRVKL